MDHLSKKLMFSLVFTLLLIGCSQTKRQQVLSVFFDGVPTADSIQTSDSVISGKDSSDGASLELSRNEPTYFYHAVYEEKQCEACHDNENANRIMEELPDLCYQCHLDFSKEYENLHVPVAMGECGECHHPHLAKHEKLLVDQIQVLCFACHSEEDIRSSDTHSEIGESSCSECHNPHGSENEYLFY
jgi:predicted CXXCH cytochrome family protein